MSQEVTNVKSQIVTSRWGVRRAMPYALTEQGVAMLSSVLNSKRAMQVNIYIMRTFTKLREFGSERMPRGLLRRASNAANA